jgi:hypothetical protein
MFDTDRSGSVNFDEFWYVSRNEHHRCFMLFLIVSGLVVSGASSLPGVVFSTVSTPIIREAYPTTSSAKPSSHSATVCRLSSYGSCTARTTDEVITI